MNKPIIVKSLAVLCALSLIGFVWLLISHLNYKNSVYGNALEEAKRLTKDSSAQIDAILANVMREAESLSAELTGGKLEKSGLLERMRKSAEADDYVFGIAVAFEPYRFSPDKKLYAPYYAKKGGTLQLVQVESIYDYTEPKHEWYSLALKGRGIWTEPYYGQASASLITVYSVPFYDGPDKKNIAGAVAFSISLDKIQQMVRTLDLGPSGFGALTSKKGAYLHHPETEYVRAQMTVFDVAEKKSDPDRLLMGNEAKEGRGGVIEHRSTSTGLSSWLVFEPIPATGWSLQNTFIKQDVPIDNQLIKRQLLGLTTFLIVFVISLAALLLKAHEPDLLRLWALSVVASLAVSTGIGFAWHVALRYDAAGAGVIIADNAGLNNMERALAEKSIAQHTEPPIFIPTGLFIESVRFGENNNVIVTGYAWQKYIKGEHDTLSRGVAFPRSESVSFTEPFIHDAEGIETVRWGFSADIRQSLDFSQYPLDTEDISISMKHKDLNHNVVLVPDLGAYKILSPTALPGLDSDIDISGWSILKTHFTMVRQSPGTDFGIGRSIAKDDFPVITYRITVRRNFIDSFISYLSPLVIVSILLFITMLINTSDPEKAKLINWGGGRMLSFSAALFFVIVFAHIDIRQKISIDSIFYLEYFYILMYATILWVSVNALLLTFVKGFRLIQYKDNLASKLLYWPTLLLLIYCITAVFFF